MDQTVWLFLLSASMFVGAFVSGYLPLSVNLSSAKLRIVTIFGAGLLVGTALIVIIPEGIAMHYDSQLAEKNSHAHEHAEAAADGAEGPPKHGSHWQIGAALAFGFAFQLIVDRISGGGHAHAHSHGEDAEVNEAQAKSKSALAGMVVHAAVDGVALGAAVKEGDSALELLVFLAIMLHKAPSSFGLTSYLLHSGISQESVRKRLLVFSSSAPLGAIFTYYLLSLNAFTYRQEMLALCLLFSGGTFLYVATAHVLPEIQAGNAAAAAALGADDADAERPGARHGHSHGGSSPKASGGGHGGHGAAMAWHETWLMVAGVLLPLLLDVHHGH